MFKCAECGHLFEIGEEANWAESRGEFWGQACYEELSGCPICKSSFEEIEPCGVCGGYNHEIGEHFCEDCKKEIKEKFRALVDEHFTNKAERELLNELYDGEWICED